jgi:multicomponent Na+:H+ antiporter subunit D
METIVSIKPLLAIVVPLATAALIALSGRRPDLRDFWTIAGALVKLYIVASMAPSVLSGAAYEYTLATILPGLAVSFRVDPLGILFALAASFLWLVTSFYSIGYMRALNERSQTRFFAFFAIAMAGAAGAAFSADMFTLFLFYEAITLSTYPLVAHNETPEAMAGARRYLSYLLGASLAFQLFAIFLTYSVAGTLSFGPGGVLAGKATTLVLTIIFVLYIAGAAKAAMMPFHAWLPAAMVAPTPVSALLHAVAVVKVGVFTVIRVVYHIFGADLVVALGLSTWLAYFACVTILAASVIALRQDNLKLRLAYSTIGQLSYIVLGAAMLTPTGAAGGVMHIVAHAFGKITLFFVAGAIYATHHLTLVSELDGIGRKMPFTMAAFTIGALSMIGLPPAAGFVSKWYLFSGAVESDSAPVMLVLAGSTLLNALYYLPIVHAAFFKEPRAGRRDSRGMEEAPAMVVVPLLVTAAGTLALFFWPSPLLWAINGVISGISW